MAIPENFEVSPLRFMRRIADALLDWEKHAQQCAACAAFEHEEGKMPCETGLFLVRKLLGIII